MRGHTLYTCETSQLKKYQVSKGAEFTAASVMSLLMKYEYKAKQRGSGNPTKEVPTPFFRFLLPVQYLE